jgi:serine/threonine protein kinase/tetratricopeptide (TPR) repeat protein
MAPVHIGRYRIIEELGRGGMGVVYRGEDPVLERQVAIKVLPPKKLTQKAVDRFLREAKTAARLDSPYIVKIHDIGEVDEIHFIVMEFVEGQTLGEILSDDEAPGSQALEERLRIFWQVLQAVRYAHDNGVIHRDLKPDNIMVTSAGQVKVMDFGLAFFEGSHSLTEVGQVMGTAAYVSPEQALGRLTDPRTDIYSLGVILFEMVTGRWPFSASNPLEMFRKVAEAPPPSPRDFNSSVPLSLEMIILRSLRKDPEDRYQNLTEFIADFEHFLKRSSLRVELPESGPPSFEAPSSPPVTLEPAAWKAPPARPPAPVFPAPGPALKAPLEATRADLQVDSPKPLPRPFSPAAPPLGTALPQAPMGVSLPTPPRPAEHDPVSEALGYPVAGTAAPEASPTPPTPATPPFPASQPAAGRATATYQPYIQSPTGSIASTSWMANVRQEQVTGRIDQLMDRLRDDEAQQNRLLAERPEATRTVCARCGAENPSERKLCAECGEVLSPSHFVVDREARTHMESGLSLYRNGRYKEAIFEFLQALSRDEDMGEAHLYLGRAYLETEEFGRARESLERAVELMEDSADPYLGLADFFQRTDQPEQVISTLHGALDRDPADANTRCRLAFLYHEHGRLDAAIDQYLQAIAHHPEHLEANRQLGLILAASDRLDEAIPFLEQACLLDPRDPHTHSLLARLYARRRHYSHAQQALRMAIQLDARDASLRADLAAVYQAQNQDHLAAQELQEALELDRGNRDASLRLAQLLERHGNTAEAVRRLDQALEFHPQDLQIHRQLGELHMRSGRLDDALSHFEEVVKLDPASAELHHRLGRIYLKKRYDEQSVQAYRKAVELHPVNPEFREDLAMAYYCSGQLPSAIHELSKASRLDYTNASYPKALGMLHVEQGEYEEAVRDLKRSLELAPADAQAHGMLGQALARQGLTNLAIAEYERALDLDPDLYLLHLSMARAYAQAGRHERAVESFRKFLARVGNQEKTRMLGEAYVDMGRSYLANNNPARAAEVFQAALQRNPRDARALHGLAEVALARKDYAKAQRWLDRALQAEPRNCELKITQARIQGMQGHWGNAVTLMQEALQDNPRRPDLHEELGRVLRKAGRFQDAVDVFRRAARIFPDQEGYFLWLTGRVQFRQDLFAEAAWSYRKALETMQHDWRIHADLGKACASLVQMDEAAAAFEKALELAPEDEVPRLRKMASRLASVQG